MRYVKFLLPLILVAIVDVLFQLGIWEPLASPESHAGMSITKKRALESPEFKHIDFVALGSSRPVYGIDHAMLAQTAAERHYTYANLTVPGTHWMSIGAITTWLARTHPEIRGGVIALSAQDFLAAGNGTYELGIAYPFRTLGDAATLEQHVEFDWHNPATYGLYSALFEYHEDVQNLLAHPLQRRKVLHWFRDLTSERVLHGDADETADMCTARIEHLHDCAELDKSPEATTSKLTAQCKQLQSAANGRYDLHPFLADHALTAHLEHARDVIRSELRALKWPTPPLIVLLPVPSIWTNEVNPPGTHEWALSVLQPLVAENRIRLVDLTELFANDGRAECSVFFDLYHNNVAGREHIMRRLEPELEKDWFGAAKDDHAATATAAH